MNPPLIGLFGMARAGKDTAADYLTAQGGDVKAGHVLMKYAFAEPLKTMLKSVFGDHFHTGDRSSICPEAGVSYRHLMQTLGTEWGRNLISTNLWVNLVQAKWEQAQRHGCGMVLSDVRFDSEAQWIRDHGGVVICIHRPGVTIDEGSDHASESGICSSLIDYIVDNNGTLEDLYLNLDGVMEHLKSGG